MEVGRGRVGAIELVVGYFSEFGNFLRGWGENEGPPYNYLRESTNKCSVEPHYYSYKLIIL